MKQPILSSVKFDNDRFNLSFENKEWRYFETQNLLLILNEYMQGTIGKFTETDLNSVIVYEGVLTFPTKPIVMEYKDGRKTKKLFDLDPDFVYKHSTLWMKVD